MRIFQKIKTIYHFLLGHCIVFYPNMIYGMATEMGEGRKSLNYIKADKAVGLLKENFNKIIPQWYQEHSFLYVYRDEGYEKYGWRYVPTQKQTGHRLPAHVCWCNRLCQETFNITEFGTYTVALNLIDNLGDLSKLQSPKIKEEDMKINNSVKNTARALPKLRPFK